MISIFSLHFTFFTSLHLTSLHFTSLHFFHFTFLLLLLSY